MAGNNEKINAIALDLTRALIANVQGGVAESEPNVKRLALGAREPVVAALARCGPEPLVGALAHHVTSLAILYEPGDPSRALAALEKFLAFTDGDDFSPEAIKAATAGVSDERVALAALRRRLDALEEELPALRARAKAAGERASALEQELGRGDPRDLGPGE